MRVNEVINSVSFKAIGSGEDAPCTGRSLLMHASVLGVGTVSAVVKVQGSNTPKVESSWLDIGLQVNMSGTGSATASAEADCEFAYVRQVLTSFTGVDVVSAISSK